MGHMLQVWLLENLQLKPMCTGMDYVVIDCLPCTQFPCRVDAGIMGQEVLWVAQVN